MRNMKILILFVLLAVSCRTVEPVQLKPVVFTLVKIESRDRVVNGDYKAHSFWVYADENNLRYTVPYPIQGVTKIGDRFVYYVKQ